MTPENIRTLCDIKLRGSLEVGLDDDEYRKTFSQKFVFQINKIRYRVDVIKKKIPRARDNEVWVGKEYKKEKGKTDMDKHELRAIFHYI